MEEPFDEIRTWKLFLASLFFFFCQTHFNKELLAKNGKQL